ncbi:hypothetical protein [Clostridium tagluense]|uniref:hypothetical protein n=1 Tax=Clostridium tagluense TaxID=360422 RepID=UPI001C0E2CBD|nr:hypothetical protein [Clostridium tagluense]MBU3129787.1 hypothetical protein [Clostridium tagluense]
MTKDIVEGKIDARLKELDGIRWLKFAGEESDRYRVVNSFTEAWVVGMIKCLKYGSRRVKK